MKTLNRINSALFTAEKWLSMTGFAGMVLVVLYSIVRREFLQMPFSAGEEITRNLTVAVIFISAAMSVNCRSHVGVEVFSNLVPERHRKAFWFFQNILELLLWLLILFFSLLVMIHYTGSGQVTPIARVPIWIIYACVPVCGVLSVYHMLVRIMNEKRKAGN